ncbi:MAG: hypothetical protein M3O71_03290 [Bacteroidota bacterium]|nr:hypothetical protein [Bacteroidota bacterium]
MTNFYTKFRLIFLPLLFTAIGTIAFYTFVNWLLIVKLSLFKIDVAIVNFMVPFFIVWVPNIIWVRPRLKLLQLRVEGRKDPVLALLILTWITMVAPLVFAQTYMVTATGKLTRLNYISEINNLPPTKYYTVNKYYINKRMVHVKPGFHTYKGDFTMTLYAAVPVFDKLFPDTNRIAAMRNSVNIKTLVLLNDSVTTIAQLKKFPADSIRMMRYVNASIVMPKYGQAGRFGALAVMTRGYHLKTELPVFKISPAAWLEIEYSKTIGSSLSVAEKDIIYRQFTAQCDTDYKHMQINDFKYLDRLPYNSQLGYYKDAILKKGDVVDGDPVILKPVYQSFDARNGDKLSWIFNSFGIGAVFFLIIISMIKLKNDVTI